MEQKGRGPERGKPLSHHEHRGIKALPVSRLAAGDCALFLWITFPMLREGWGRYGRLGLHLQDGGLRVGEAVPQIGQHLHRMGYWTRANAEICLLATRGHPKRAARDVKQVILSHVEEHSKKPDEARRRIEALMGDVPRIELFARQATPGWDVWGNEVASDIQLAERS